jgi:holo-[acyl-carrier protein] synthase
MILGTGVDIIEINRIQKAIARWGENFLRHVFSDEEIQYARSRKFPAQHFAVRFAAKEAVYKAIPDNARIGWKDIKIFNDKNGRPQCTVNKDNFKNKVLISLSHSHDYAVANAIITS